MESKLRAIEDSFSSSLAPFPTDARFPAQAIQASEFRLREHEVEVGKNFRCEWDVELRIQEVRFSPQESTKHKAKGGASTSSSPTPKPTKPTTSQQSQQQASTNKPTKPAKQGGQQNKSQNTGGNGESRTDVKVTVGVNVNLDKNKVVSSSGTAVRALKANKSGGNNEVVVASKGKPQGCVKKY